MIPITAFNIDRIVSPAEYASGPSGELLVHGEFHTIQGEGPFAGQPAYFVRLAGCNYGDKQAHCHFCDTSFHFDSGTWRSAASLVDNARNADVSLLVLTGGEPLLQYERVRILAEECEEAGMLLQIETNGVYHKQLDTLLYDFEDFLEVVISPKAHEQHGYSRTLMSKLVDLYHNHAHAHFKILIGAEPYHVLPELLAQAEAVDSRRIFLSPVTVYRKPPSGEVASAWDPELVDQRLTAANHAKAASLCIERGFRLSMQMHNFCTIP